MLTATPCQHDFFILSPRCETGVCRTGLSRPPDTLQYPFPLQHVPDATLVTVFLSVKVSLSSRVSDYLPPVTHAGVPLTLSFFYYDSLSDLPCYEKKLCLADKCFLAQLIAPHHPIGCPGCFCVLQDIFNVRNDMF